MACSISFGAHVYKDLIISTIVDAPLLAFFKAYRL